MSAPADTVVAVNLLSVMFFAQMVSLWCALAVFFAFRVRRDRQIRQDIREHLLQRCQDCGAPLSVTRFEHHPIWGGCEWVMEAQCVNVDCSGPAQSDEGEGVF